MNRERTAILLATYNSGRFLREQLDSLYAQTYTDWTLYVHDDGSSDATLSILEEYRTAKGNIEILVYPRQGTARDNFLSMLDRVDADYYFYCDHDDVWLEDKVEFTLTALRREEDGQQNVPALAFTDLVVVDADLRPLHNSMWRFQGLRPERLHTLSDYAAQVPATGCTMCFNAAAKRCVVRPWSVAKMHDAWLLLSVVRAGGKTIPLARPTILYRQNGDNVEGAKSKWDKLSVERLRTLFSRNRESYRMLAALGYGSPVKYMLHKLKFYLNIQQRLYNRS